MDFDPAKQIADGSKILDSVMSLHGFVFILGPAGKGSGGNFACGDYRRDDRVLTLHYRFGLGMVQYRIGDEELEHNTYMKLLGVWDQSEFSRTVMDSTLDGFVKLRADLERFGEDFLSGDGTNFKELARRFKADPGMFSGFKAL